MFTPDLSPMITVIRLKKRQEILVNGAPKPSYIDANPALDCCNWKGMGGTEVNSNGLLLYANTAQVVMWYRSDISIKDLVVLNDTAGQEYEIVSPPENIEMRCQYLSFKVQRVGGA